MKARWGLVAALVLAAVPAQAQVREIRLDDAIQRGLDHSPDLRMGDSDVAKARAETASSLGNLGPKLSIDGGIQRWDQATDVSFINVGNIGGSALAADMAKFAGTYPALGGLFGGLVSSLGQPTRVQDQVTANVGLQAVQVLTPLYSMISVYKLDRAAEKAAKLTADGTRDLVTFRVTQAFLGVLAAQHMIEVAKTAVEQVDAHLKTAHSFYDAGIVGKDDVLRAEAALARAQDGLNQAQSAGAMARASLNVAIGLGPSEPTQPVGDYPDTPPELKVTMDDALQRAAGSRTELKATERRVEMASLGRHAAIGQMIPVIAGLFRYAHTEGSEFQRKDAWFVGASLNWTFWEWGAQYYKVRSAEADKAKANEGLDAVRDGVVLDVTKAYLDVRQSRSSIDMNRKAVEASEEALRVVTRKYEAQTATSVEILDAQSALTQAKAAFQVAVYTYYINVANLRRAVGTEL